MKKEKRTPLAFLRKTQTKRLRKQVNVLLVCRHEEKA